MSNFFAECTTQDEAKSLYRKLARQHHPDFGGDEATMKQLNSEYAAFQATTSHRAERKRQSEAHADGKKTNADYVDLDAIAAELRQKIEALLNISSELEVELCGLWVWVTGNTKPHKEAIKAVGGMRWASEKEAWYFAGVRSFNRQKMTLDQVRQAHGSQRVSRKTEREALPS